MNFPTPLVSVIIPFYNNTEWLSQALRSVAAQTYNNLEVIIINDGSVEDISKLEETFTSFLFFTTENFGAGAARNFGIERATGDFLCFLDSDDLWLATKVEKQVSYMLDNSLIWSHTNYATFQEGLPAKLTTVNTQMSGFVLPKMLISCPIGTPCVMIENNVLKSNRNLRFNDNFSVGEDGYLWFCLAEIYELGHISENLTMVRLRGSNAAFDAKRQLEAKTELFDIIKKNKKWFANNFEYVLVSLGFGLAKKIYFMLNFILPDNKNAKRFTNFIYKGFYAIPYFYLRSLLKLLPFKSYIQTRSTNT